MLLIKIFLNSVISTKGAKFANADLANFYLMTPLKRPEYAKIKLSDIPKEVINEHNLNQYAIPDGWVCWITNRVTRGGRWTDDKECVEVLMYILRCCSQTSIELTLLK